MMSIRSADTNDGRVSLEKRASVKEKEEDSTATPSAPGSIKTSESDYPDGGLRAWLIVVGVRSLFQGIYFPLNYSLSCIIGNVQYLCQVSTSTNRGAERRSLKEAQASIGMTSLLLSCRMSVIFSPISVSFGYVNTWGVSNGAISFTFSHDSALQIFQKYYETALLKSTPPSSMWVPRQR